MATIRIYLPCPVVPVRVRLGYGAGGLSKMEASLLRAVVTLSIGSEPDRGASVVPGPVPLADLVDIFGLGRAMTMHAMADLWRRGHVTLDLRDSLVLPEQQTVNAHLAGRLDKLAAGESALDVVEVLQECVTGQVVGLSGYVSPPDPSLALPRDPLFTPSPDDISPSELLAAVERVLDRTAADPGEADRPVVGAGRRAKVREIHLDRSRTTLPSIRWLPLDVSARRDSDSDRIRVSVADRLLDQRRRELAGERISQFLEQSRNHPFVQHLGSQVNVSFDAPLSLDRHVEKLERMVATTGIAAPGTRRAQHGRLVSATQQVRDLLRYRQAAQVKVRVVGSGPEYVATVHELVGRARRQILFASPLVGQGLEDLIGPLEEAVRRGVQVVVLWGSRRERTLDPRHRRILEYLDSKAREAGGRVLFAGRPGRSGACLTVVDGTAALVGGHPFLGDGRPRRGELGLLVEAPTAAPSELVLQLLAWSRRAMSDYRTSRAILFRHGEVAAPTEEVDEPAPAAAADIADPPQPPDGDDAEAEAAVRLWSAAWTDVAHRLRTAVRTVEHPAAVMVEDASHRDVLWDSVRDARSRLVFGADQISSQVLGNRLLAALAMDLDNGVQVRTVYRRSGSTEYGQDPHGAMRGLEEGRPAGSCQVLRAQTNGRALICDDTVVVGSFDFLAHEGYFSRTGNRPDSEIGLKIVDRTVADAVGAALHAVTVPVGEPVPSPPAVTPEGPAQLGTAAAVALLTEVGSEPEPDRRAELVRTAVEQTGAALLDSLLAADAPADVIRIAAAWSVYGRLRDGADPDVLLWAGWLLRDAWRRGDVEGCRVLRGALETTGAAGTIDARAAGSATDGDLPDQQLIELAGTLGTSRAAEVVQSMALAEQLPPRRRDLLLLVSCGELLTGANDSGATKLALDLIDYLTDAPDLAGTWRGLGELLLGADAQAFPMPLAALREEAERDERRRVLDAAWQRFGDDLVAARSITFAFDAGIKTQAHLFHPAGPFGRVVDAVARRDIAAVRDWQRDGQLRDLAGLIDGVSDQVTNLHSRIDGRPRKSYLQKLSTVVQAAHRLARQPDVPASNPAEVRLTAVCRALAADLATAWPAVVAAVTAAPSPEREVLDRMVERIEPIVEWGRAGAR